jgi:hypothetical protein
MNIETLQVMEPKKKHENPIYYIPFVIFWKDKIKILSIVHTPMPHFPMFAPL